MDVLFNIQGQAVPIKVRRIAPPAVAWLNSSQADLMNSS
jgi:ABC-type multidrug transport system fused ATPase/permease subunit